MRFLSIETSHIRIFVGDDYPWASKKEKWRVVVVTGIGGTCLVAVRTRPYVHLALLDSPDPECEKAIQTSVDGDGRSGVMFCVVKAELVVPTESCGADHKSEIANGKPYVGQKV
jgi:hypothetical protein